MTKGLHLSPRHREEIEALLHKHLPGVEVWAYGSRVNGRSHDGSDLDLVLHGPKLAEIGTSRFADFIEALQDSTIPFLVEVRDWARLPESFHCEIEREHVVLVTTKNDAVCAWPRVALRDVIYLRLSSVDKKTNPTEHAVRLCNYMDVYRNSFIHGGLDFMKATATEQEIANCSLFSGDVVITKDSEKHDDIGVPALVRENIPRLVCGYHLAILRPISIDGSYLFYALSTNEVQQQFHSYANGVTRFGLRKADIGLVETPLPPPPEQRAIAHILGTLDDKIELNRRKNETLEAMARALFKSWFVDFDPVRAKMAGRDPGLPQHLADLFPDRLVDSELGEIPEGWEVKALDGIAVFQNGLALQKHRPQANEERLPVVKIAQLRSGQADSREWASANIKPECIINDGDVVFSWSGSLMVTIWCGGQAALNQHLFKVTSTQFPKWFCLYCTESHLPDFRRIASGKATTMGHIKRHHLTDAKCVVPTWQILSSVDNTFSSLFSKTISLSLESRTLAVLRDTLLPKLISGKLRTSNVSMGVIQ